MDLTNIAVILKAELDRLIRKQERQAANTLVTQEQIKTIREALQNKP